MSVGIERKLKRGLIRYLHLDSDYFENISNYSPDSSEWLQEVEQLTPAEWTMEKKRLWYFAYNGDTDLPEQGFKIHVSATSQTASETLRKVVPVCVREEAVFKFCVDPEILDIVNSKNFSRGSSGKFVTVYPNDIDHFKRILEQLHRETGDLKGPRILSDRPYKDSRVLFYRYGGFKQTTELNLYGEQRPVISTPEGETIPDRRTPFFQTPPWVQDPFDSEEKDSEEKEDGSVRVVLNGRYNVGDPLSFSNAGGVYEAHDQETGQDVIIKEARPFVGVTKRSEDDAVDTLRNEYEMLSELNGTGSTPDSIDYFREGNHSFLVEEYVEGTPLTTYRAVEDAGLLLRDRYDEETIRDFCESFSTIGRNLLDAVQSIHSQDIVIGDLSPSNVLIDTETLELKIIDFEGAAYVGEERDLRNNLFTKGYVPPERLEQDENLYTVSEEDDYYAAGGVLSNLVIPAQVFFHLNPDARKPFAEQISKDTGLPDYVTDVVFSLMYERDIDGALGILEANDGSPELNLSSLDGDDIYQRADVHTSNPERLEDRLDEISRFIKATADHSRQDRLWPADYRVFSTNPLGIAYGALGTALFLEESSRGLPEDTLTWILDRCGELDADNYAPGLYSGLSGIAWTLSELGLSHGERVFDLVHESGLVHSGPDVFYGDAGIGLASLHFWRKTGDERYLDLAREAGEHILQTSESTEEGFFWVNADGGTYHGYAHGASGIALFLLRLHTATDDARFLKHGRGAMEFEMAHAKILGENDSATWSRQKGGSIYSPYWRTGAAGVGSALIRFHDVTGEEKYLDWADKCSRYVAKKYAVLPGQFNGMSGMGEFLLDMYFFTGEERYLSDAYKLTNVLLFKIDKQEGIAFPGAEQIRVSNDFGTGSAGVGMFLNRLLRPSPRAFYELDRTAQMHSSKKRSRSRDIGEPLASPQHT